VVRRDFERFGRAAGGGGLPRSPGRAFVLACALSACGDQPVCPAGTDFDDCKGSPVQAAPLLPSTAMAGSGGGSASPAQGLGGSSSEQPVSMLTPVSQPAPMVMMTAPPAVPMDVCADDPLKMAPGVCGCGVPDDDFDGDNAVDCRETCPDNAARAAPLGPCGCSNLADMAGCTELRGALRNLYTFSGTGLTVVDSVGARNGTIADAVGLATPAALGRLQQNGRVNLDGAGSFVELPDGLISGLTSATFEVWLSWRGGAAWARIFDFGSSNGNVGQTYLFLTPSNSENNSLRVAYSIGGGGAAETVADGLMALPIAASTERTLQHVAVVVDDAAGALRLYANGAEVRTVPFAGDLALIQDVNNWLGRSNYSVDPPLFGSLIEFRIYGQALTAAQLGLSFRAGPGSLG
jgi:hypothetical protein